MPRFALLLIAALALLFGASAAQAAAAAPPAPVAGASQDDLSEDELLEEEDACVFEEDACLEEDWGDDELLACDEELLDDEEWIEEEDEGISDEETYVDDAEIAAADEDCGVEPVETVAPELTALSAAVGGDDGRPTIQVAFRLDEPGKVELTLARTGAATSRRAAGKAACPSGVRGAAAKGTGKAKGKKCSGALPGRMLVNARAGLNRFDLRGRWRGKKLAPGSYRLTATPRAPGATSDVVTFKIAAS